MRIDLDKRVLLLENKDLFSKMRSFRSPNITDQMQSVQARMYGLQEGTAFAVVAPRNENRVERSFRPKEARVLASFVSITVA